LLRSRRITHTLACTHTYQKSRFVYLLRWNGTYSWTSMSTHTHTQIHTLKHMSVTHTSKKWSRPCPDVCLLKSGGLNPARTLIWGPNSKRTLWLTSLALRRTCMCACVCVCCGSLPWPWEEPACVCVLWLTSLALRRTCMYVCVCAVAHFPGLEKNLHVAVHKTHATYRLISVSLYALHASYRLISVSMHRFVLQEDASVCPWTHFMLHIKSSVCLCTHFMLDKKKEKTTQVVKSHSPQ